MKNLKLHRWTFLTAAPVALALSIIGTLMASVPANNLDVEKPVASPISEQQLGVANSLSQAFRNVATHVLPSVVAIENRPDTTWHTAAKPPSDMPNSSPNGGPPSQANPFEGTPFGEMFRGRPSNPEPEFKGGIGSGVIIESAGIVLTNNHVVAGGGKVVIRTHDGREFVATEVLTDPQTDIAVVKFNGDPSLVAATIGDSDAMEVGDWVVALGQPFGLEGTVTTGIVSAKNRGIGITDRENFIQTDAAINPGNSGGPLVNLRGEVVGINTAISSQGGGNNGVGFAVPSNLADWVSDQLVATGHVNRSYLGVSIQPVNYELSTQLGVAPKSGVAVTNVFPDTPAAKADMKTGDVIVKFGETFVTSPQQLQIAVERAAAGTAITVEIVRDGKPMKLSYTGEATPNQFGVTSSPKTSSVRKMQSLGLEISVLTDVVAKQLGMDNQTGVVVTRVQDSSAAAKAGLESGMVIVQVNRQDVSSPEEFGKLVKADTDHSILLLVRTDQGSRFVIINHDGNPTPS